MGSYIDDHATGCPANLAPWLRDGRYLAREHAGPKAPGALLD